MMDELDRCKEFSKFLDAITGRQPNETFNGEVEDLKLSMEQKEKEEKQWQTTVPTGSL
jgi:hypothetical protein